MAKKELTENDLWKKDLRSLMKDYNQLLKEIAPMTYYGYSGLVPLKSTETYLERIAVIYNQEVAPIRCKGILTDTDTVYQFYKNFKVSKMKINILEDKIIIGQDGIDERFDLQLNWLLNERDEIRDKEIIETIILPEFYQKMPKLLSIWDLIYHSDRFNHWNTISDEDIDAMREGEMISLVYSLIDKDIHAYITKEIFPLIKKDTDIKYTVLNIQNDLDSRSFYILYREEIESVGMYIYTLTSAYQSI